MSMTDDMERELGNLTLNNCYRVDGVLSEGGFGKVYYAEHVLYPEKHYAVKKLNIKELERSKRLIKTPILKFVEGEARKLANLMHDAIPRTYQPWFDGENYFLLDRPGAYFFTVLKKNWEIS